jgi:cob(I)alamin adenosyltransferase
MMAKQATDKSPRKFDPMIVPGLSNEARDAVNAAFDAMSTWCTETVNTSEKNLEQVIEKMAAAARALGWPEQIVDATRSEMRRVTKTQIQMMDQLVDAWEEQIKSPNPSAMLSKLSRCRVSGRREIGQISLRCPR